MKARGSLSWWAGFLIYLIILLSPAIWMYKYIEWWALIPCAAFWVIVAVALRETRKYLANRSNDAAA